VHLASGRGGAPASRALDAAVRLLQDRTGRIDVVYVAHLSSLAALSADAIAEEATCPEVPASGQRLYPLGVYGGRWKEARLGSHQRSRLAAASKPGAGTAAAACPVVAALGGLFVWLLLKGPASVGSPARSVA
jgi:hypothetical protein